MPLPRRSWPWLALAALAVPAVVRGCVSVAHAAEDLDAAGMGGWGMGGAGGIGGGILVLAMMLLRDEIKGRREAKQPRADDEPRHPPILTRGDVEVMIDRAARELRVRMDEQHARVRATDRDREAHILRIDNAQSDLRLQIAGRLASAEADLKTLIREAGR